MKYNRKQDVLAAGLHDEIVMMDIEKGKYFTLNPVGTVIWNLLESPKSLEELCVELIKEFEVEPQTCLEETSAYLENLLKLGLIEKAE
jgi:hypothetical protein